MDNNELNCYNKGCGKSYIIGKASEDECCYHPGEPIFHDAYKAWSCCKKKTTDFTTFLNTKGCAYGKHNPIKPIEPLKERLESSDEVIVVRPPVKEPTVRPDNNLEMMKLQVLISQSLEKALKQKSKEILGEEDTTCKEINLAESCKNNACTASYEGEESNTETCCHHPGVPIFHEGLKFWSCCKKRTTDFDEFLKQKGCMKGNHLWIEKTTKKISCRYDWHQTATHVYVTVYAKCSLPKLSSFLANPIHLYSKIIFGEEHEFKLDKELGGVINIKASSVTMAATKVEVKLKKADSSNWQTLFLLPKEPSEAVDLSKSNDIEAPIDDLQAVDLSDL